MPRAPSRNPLVRALLTALGFLIMLVSPLVGAIPGPGGIFVFAGGLVLVLRNAAWARRHMVRIKRRWPRLGYYVDMALRRRSFLRRRARAREAELADAEAELLGVEIASTGAALPGIVDSIR